MGQWCAYISVRQIAGSNEQILDILISLYNYFLVYKFTLEIKFTTKKKIYAKKIK